MTKSAERTIVKSTHTVVTDYRSPYNIPVQFVEGETIEILQKETEWPGWIWCINSQGESRWIPDVYLQVDGNKGTLLKDYNARELTAQEGEMVKVFYQVNEWGWCRDSKGDDGWLPLDHLEEL